MLPRKASDRSHAPFKVLDSLPLKASIVGHETRKVQTCCCHSRPLIEVTHHLRSLTLCYSRPQLEVMNPIRSRLVSATEGLMVHQSCKTSKVATFDEPGVCILRVQTRVVFIYVSHPSQLRHSGKGNIHAADDTRIRTCIHTYIC